MKNFKLLLFAVVLPFFCMAQNLRIEYDYDKSGNRTSRKTIYLAPPAPPEDSIQVTSNELQVTGEEYFVEKVAQVEMRVYPNPATEKIAFSIFNTEKMQTGLLQLYSLSGQLLQTQLIQSGTTEVSLVGLSKGTYILKVQINEHTENWKIIKQ